jgi:serine protease AprX
MATPDAGVTVKAQARALGARITRDLTTIDGFAADIPQASVVDLMSLSGIRSVTPDRTVRPLSVLPSLGYDPADTGAPAAVTKIVGAQTAWASGVTGRGVDVAVIDTGIGRVPGLDAPGQVVDGPDLSLDAPSAPVTGLDAYGHGTFMAGLIAARDPGPAASTGCSTCQDPSGYSDPTRYVGVAPDARLVNVKVGASDGAADVSQVIAGIDWVTQHAQDPGFNIRVLNLSFGTDSNQLYDKDPLAQAAEQAWMHGIVVVVAAGNDGRGPGKLSDPAYDPYVIAAGADDPAGTMTVADDRVPDFAQHGTQQRPVDVVAPATHVIGLRVPGSFIDSLNGNTGLVGTRFQRGSGTSEAAAVVSGAAALLLQRFPSATPNGIKQILDGSAHLLPRLPGKDNTAEKYSGNGVLDVAGALNLTPTTAVQTWTASSGTGSLDKSRAGQYVTDDGTDLRGETDIFGRPFTSARMAALQESASAWAGGTWNGSKWTGDGWTTDGWASTAWSGTDWRGRPWSSIPWTGSKWTGSKWTGSKWTGSKWTGSKWTGSKWTGSKWTDAAWSTSDWS